MASRLPPQRSSPDCRAVTRRFRPRISEGSHLDRAGVGSIVDRTVSLTVIVPAYNEAGTISDTIRSIQAQTVPPREIIVVDDGSTDRTGDVPARWRATVLRPPANTGSKAGAQTFALARVTTDLTMAIDADTILAPDAIESLLPALDDANVAAACGLVLPRKVSTIFERGRYIE